MMIIIIQKISNKKSEYEKKSEPAIEIDGIYHDFLNHFCFD